MNRISLIHRFRLYSRFAQSTHKKSRWSNHRIPSYSKSGSAYIRRPPGSILRQDRTSFALKTLYTIPPKSPPPEDQKKPKTVQREELIPNLHVLINFDLNLCFCITWRSMNVCTPRFGITRVLMVRSTWFFGGGLIQSWIICLWSFIRFCHELWV